MEMLLKARNAGPLHGQLNQAGHAARKHKHGQGCTAEVLHSYHMKPVKCALYPCGTHLVCDALGAGRILQSADVFLQGAVLKTPLMSRVSELLSLSSLLSWSPSSSSSSSSSSLAAADPRADMRRPEPMCTERGSPARQPWSLASPMPHPN